MRTVQLEVKVWDHKSHGLGIYVLLEPIKVAPYPLVPLTPKFTFRGRDDFKVGL